MTDEEREKLHAARIELLTEAVAIARQRFAEMGCAMDLAERALAIAESQLSALRDGVSQ